MVVKQNFVIIEEVMKNNYNLFGQNGCLTDNTNQIMLLDFAQMGQYILENTLSDTIDEEYEFAISKAKVTSTTKQWAEEIAKIILDEVVSNALSDAEDDEEVMVIE